MDGIIMFIIIITILMVSYKLWEISTYWKKLGIPHIQPKVLVGNMWNVICKKQSMSEFLRHLYTSAGHARYFGVYYFAEPCLLLKDLDLIKEMTVKNYETFPVRSITVSEHSDPFISNIVLFLNDTEKLRKVRSAISPLFTSSKIKTMFDLMNCCVSGLVEFLEEQDGRDLEAKILFSKYAMDVIRSCGVGHSYNSFRRPDDAFIKLVRNAIATTTSLRGLIHEICPAMGNILKMPYLKKQDTEHWISFMNDAIRSRENGLYREDMLQWLLKTKNRDETSESKELQYHLTDHDISSQILMLFLAGYDTTSSALTFASYELAVNFNVQVTLQREVDAVLEKCNGNSINYEDVMEMKYLDAVVSETLRLWPSVTYVGRRSKSKYVIKPTEPNEKPLELRSGFKIWIPIFAIQRDPKYHPDPDKFCPERFLGDNKEKMAPFSYIPFGLGQRVCLGNRFAMLEIKLVLFHILAKFTIVPVDRTPIPMRIKGLFLMESEKECWIAFKPRRLTNGSSK